MKKIATIMFSLFIFASQAQSWKELKNAAKKINKELLINETYSEKEASDALKETLNIGVVKGVDLLSVKDGYLLDPKVKIPFPKSANKVAKKLNSLGMKKQIENAVESINRAAENAVNSAKPIFTEAIEKMSIIDAKKIIKGNKTAGTDYLSKNTKNSLITVFKPIIRESLNNVNATKNWNVLMSAYNKIPFVEKVNTDLDTYVTEKAIDGLFVIISEEEISIRENPKERVSKLLKKVFGTNNSVKN
jgi:hypothetical protein